MYGLSTSLHVEWMLLLRAGTNTGPPGGRAHVRPGDGGASKRHAASTRYGWRASERLRAPVVHVLYTPHASSECRTRPRALHTRALRDADSTGPGWSAGDDQCNASTLKLLGESTPRGSQSCCMSRFAAGLEQVESCAPRSDRPVPEVERWLVSNLEY
jgi:hypothetical protein